MQTTRGPRRLAVAACTTLLLATLAGCGGSGGGATAAPATPTPSVAPTAIPSASDAPTPTPAPTPDVQALLDAKRAEFESPGGLALLVRDGIPAFYRSGSADIAGTPIDESTRFRAGSITKTFVAALTADAAARGELSLDDIVGDLLPGVLRTDPPVTVRQLLDHTSGIFDWLNEGSPADVAKIEDPAIRAEAETLVASLDGPGPVTGTTRAIVALAETHDRYFAPGTNMHYSNTNYHVAGMVLEKVTGTTLAELLRARILQPLALERTSLAPAEPASPEMRGYSGEPSAPVDATDLSVPGNGGDGGLVSSAGDLYEALRAIVTGRLRPGLLDTMLPTAGMYGLGLYAYQSPCGIFLGHDGAVDGTVALVLVSPKGDDGVVLAFNRAGRDPAAIPSMTALADLLLCPGS